MSQFVYIPESDIWTDKVRMVQTKDPVLGGKDGPANWAAQDLTNRTLFLKKAVEAAQTSANAANTAAKNADTKAGTAQTTANQAKTAATNAQKTADDAKSAAATADGKAVAAQTSANAANTAAKNADTKAGAAQTTANQAKTAAATAQSTADTAKSDAATADSKAVAAQTSANAANTAAKNADTKAGTAQTTANQAKTAAATAQSTADTAKSDAATADSKAVAAQTSANTANTAAKNADAKAGTAQTTANQAKTAADKAQQSADEAFKDRGALGTIDLDTLGSAEHCGIYHQTGNANATPARHYPESMAGSLFVMMAAGVTQMYIRYNSNNVWLRNNYGGKWSNWDRLATSSEVIKLLQTIGTSTTAAMSQKAVSDLVTSADGARYQRINKTLIQKGFTHKADTQEIKFPIAFSNDDVIVLPIYHGDPGNSDTVAILSVNKTGFKAKGKIQNGSSLSIIFDWVAFGE